MKKLLKYFLISIQLLLSSLGIAAPMKLNKDEDHDSVIPTTLKKSQVDQEEKDGIRAEIVQFVDLAFKKDEEEIYKALGIPLFKGSINYRYQADFDSSGNLINTGIVGKTGLTLEKIHELTDKEKQLVKEWKEKGKKDGFSEGQQDRSEK